GRAEGEIRACSSDHQGKGRVRQIDHRHACRRRPSECRTRVATIDLDSRQKRFTRYLENRRAWARQARADLKLPMHFCVARGTTFKLDENEAIEFAGFAEAISAVERSHDFVVVDTAGTDNYLT